jgi:hypothetical protein
MPFLAGNNNNYSIFLMTLIIHKSPSHLLNRRFGSNFSSTSIVSSDKSFLFILPDTIKKTVNMIKLQVIGHLGRDGVVNNVNGKNVINFSVAHAEKF